jgi:hypothetical protein
LNYLQRDNERELAHDRKVHAEIRAKIKAQEDADFEKEVREQVSNGTANQYEDTYERRTILNKIERENYLKEMMEIL